MQLPACNQTPEPARWLNAGTPDQGAARPLISAHRGALTLAPENTLASYEYAFAFGVALVEVDIQQTKDGKFVALHDDTVDRTTNGTGNISDLTYDEVRALNAADYEPWKGGPYDGAQVASVEEVLQLAKRVGGGLELDIKGSVTEEGKLAQLVKQYGLIEESIFNSGDIRIFQVDPAARIIYNRDRWEPPYLMYEIARVAPVFGSRRDEYNAESVVAIHDGCGVVMPHAYDAGPDGGGQRVPARPRNGRRRRADQPAGEDRRRRGHPRAVEAPAERGSRLPRQPRQRARLPDQADRARRRTAVTAGRGGCVDVPAGTTSAQLRRRRRGHAVERDAGRRRRHGAGDARADAGRAGELRRLHARHRARVHGVDHRDGRLDRRRRGADRRRPDRPASSPTARSRSRSRCRASAP